jgi:hypothetical protein
MSANPPLFQQQQIDEGHVNFAEILSALVSTASKLESVMRQQNDDKAQLKEIVDTLHKLDKRMAVFESNSVAGLVKDHEQRIAKLEARGYRQEGALGVVDWLAKNWPSLIAVGTMAAIFLRQNGLV